MNSNSKFHNDPNCHSYQVTREINQSESIRIYEINTISYWSNHHWKIRTSQNITLYEQPIEIKRVVIYK